MRIFNTRIEAQAFVEKAQEVMGGIVKIKKYTPLYRGFDGRYVIANYSFNGEFCGYY
jgi:hypothetical protein